MRPAITLVLPLPASWNSLYNKNRWGDIYLSAFGKEYEKFIREYVQREMDLKGYEKLLGDVVAIIYIAWPDDKRSRDAENVGKLLFDTLKDVAFEDDCYMFPQYQAPTTVDKEHPRVLITIMETGELDRDFQLPAMPRSLEIWQEEKDIERKEAAARKRKRNKEKAAAKRQALAGSGDVKALPPPKKSRTRKRKTVEDFPANQPLPDAFEALGVGKSQ